jgi:hypothetical protein
MSWASLDTFDPANEGLRRAGTVHKPNGKTWTAIGDRYMLCVLGISGQQPHFKAELALREESS